MKKAGFLLLVAGFLGGAFATALDIERTNWEIFVPAALAALVGVTLIKRHARGEATSDRVLTANRSELTDSLGAIVTNLQQIIDAGDQIPVGDLRREVDARLRDDLRRFADARESLIHLHGLQAYADIMSEFAAGERYVNRVWSASADGYGHEARNYLGRAVEQFREAASRLGSASA